MTTVSYRVNPGKQLVVRQGERQYYCFAVKTRLITAEDKLADIVAQYVQPILQPGDTVFISEKMVACTQGRALLLASIHPGFWAKLLCRFVVKTPAGIGLGIPQTMQCAIDECGLPRILAAAAAGALGKLLGKKGWFYRVAGAGAAAIDGPCHWTIPPYNKYVVLAPRRPRETAEEISRLLGGAGVLIVDLNDLGGRILGCANAGERPEHILALLRQNPLGQEGQSTPIGVLREKKPVAFPGQGRGRPPRPKTNGASPRRH